MPILPMHLISPIDMATDEEALFVMAGTMDGHGANIEARLCEHFPNAVLIPIKRRPAKDEDAFLKEADHCDWQLVMHMIAWRLRDKLRHGGRVFWPVGGLNAAHARLEANAPSIFNELNARCYLFLKTYGRGMAIS